MTGRRLLIYATLSGLIVLIVFEVFLGHRHDYSGHYAAGFGMTFAGAMLLLKVFPRARHRQVMERLVLPFCLVCILGGALAEATVFRLAKFDLVDFFNQSLGAVLATICATAFLGHRRPSSRTCDFGLFIGMVFLGIGGVLAFA